MAEMTPVQRGRQSEANVKACLAELRDTGKILGFRQTRRFSKADRRGIDFFIFTESGRIPLQVKSSFRGMDNHNHYDWTCRVPCVVGQGGGLMHRIYEIIRKHMKASHYGHPTG